MSTFARSSPVELCGEGPSRDETLNGCQPHHLRYKIAAAAVLKGAAWRVARLPGARAAIGSLAHRLKPPEEATGSYRGLLAGLLQEAVDTSGGEAIAYDGVAGLVRAPKPTPMPDLETLTAQAQRTLNETTPSAGALIALAAAYRKSYTADFEAAASWYEKAYEVNPKDLRAVEGILSSGARSHYDWPRIWSYTSSLKPTRGPLAAATELWISVDALFQAEPPHLAVRAAVHQPAEHAEALNSVHQLLLETLAVRLQFLGEFRAGTALRQAMAQDRAAELSGIPLESPVWLKHLLGAHAYLEHHQRLQRLATRPPVDTPRELASTQVQKLRADVALFHGDAGPLINHARKRAEGLPLPGEEKMRELVTGRRVAIVGPAATGDELGELIDSHDVIVQTRFRPEMIAATPERMGSRTDIAYYSGLNLSRGFEEARSLAESGAVRLAVTRPLYWPVLQELPAWLRVARSEFGLYYRGAPMAIQRIIYDLLQFAPAEIGIFNADFYASAQLLTAGYRDDAATFGPHSQLNDPVVMHDLAFEFRLTQKWARTGLIVPHGAAAEVLELNEEQYLRRLEEHNPLGRARQIRHRDARQ